jgi:putative transposase
VSNIPTACVDDLRGFPKATENPYPQNQVGLRILYLFRYSLRYVRWKARKVIASDLRMIRVALTAGVAEQEPEALSRR